MINQFMPVASPAYPDPDPREFFTVQVPYDRLQALMSATAVNWPSNMVSPFPSMDLSSKPAGRFFAVTRLRSIGPWDYLGFHLKCGRIVVN